MKGHNAKPFICRVCTKTFLNAWALQQHMTSHATATTTTIKSKLPKVETVEVAEILYVNQLCCIRSFLSVAKYRY